MNIQSALLLIFILAVFLLVFYRYVKRQRHGGCGCCNGSDTCGRKP